MLSTHQEKALRNFLLTDSDLKALLEKHGWDKLKVDAEKAKDSDIYAFAEDVANRLESLGNDICDLAATKGIKVYRSLGIQELFSKKIILPEENIYNTLIANIFRVHSMITVHLKVVSLRENVKIHLLREQMLEQQ